MTGGHLRAMPGAPGIVDRALAWQAAHPGWHLDVDPPWWYLAGPDGQRQGHLSDLVTMVDLLERADLRVSSEREQLALLREEFRDSWSVTYDAGCHDEHRWEALPRGLLRPEHAVTAPEAWLLCYRLYCVHRC